MPATRFTGHRPPLLATLALGLGLIAGPAVIAHAASNKTSTATATSESQVAKTGSLHTYKTETEAQSGCHGDTVVWHASGSKVFHTSGSRYYGKTKHGGYACEKAAKADGLRLSKS